MTTPDVGQSLQAITLSQWLPVMKRWLGLSHALVVGHSQQALRLLNSYPEALTLFKAGSAEANPAPSPAAQARPPHAAAHTWPWLIAEHSGMASFHHASLQSESGLLPATALTACWPGIKPLGQYQASSLSLDDACAQASAARAWASPPQWLWIGCLPATALLRGATQVLHLTDVVVMRVQLHPDAHPDASLHSAQTLLQAQGFALCGVETERNPHLGIALFVRDYPAAYSTTSGELNALQQAHIGLKSQLQTLQQKTAELKQGQQAEAQVKTQALAQVLALQQEKEALHSASAQQMAQLTAQLQAEAQTHAQAQELLQAQKTALQQQNEEHTAVKEHLLAQLQNLQQQAAELKQGQQAQAKIQALEQIQALQQEKEVLHSANAQQVALLTAQLQTEAQTRQALQAETAALQQQRDALAQAKEAEVQDSAHQRQNLQRQMSDWQQRFAQLESEKRELDQRLCLLREELIKSEAQLELIEDLLLKSPKI